MKKNIILLLVVVFAGLTSCTDDNDPKVIKNKIGEYKTEIVNLQTKIKELNDKLDKDKSSKDDGSILVGIKTMETTQFINYLNVTGNIVSNQEALISPEINGQIEHIYIKEGDYVSKGTLLVSLKTEITEKTIEEVKTSLELAKTVYKKQKELWDQQIGSEIQYLQAKSKKESLERRLETLQTQVDMASIRAPFDGFIEIVFQKEGEIASPGRQVLQLVNLSDLKVTADVSESYLPNLAEGDKVLIEFPTFPSLSIESKIAVIGSIINPNNRTVKIQVKIPNPDNMLKPNVIANIKLIQAVYDSALVVPSIIVKNDASGRNYIYLKKKKEGKFYAAKRYVKTGVSYGNNTLIIGGLEPNEEVIFQGYNMVKNGSLIRVK